MIKKCKAAEESNRPAVCASCIRRSLVKDCFFSKDSYATDNNKFEKKNKFFLIFFCHINKIDILSSKLKDKKSRVMPSHSLSHIKIDDIEILGYSVAGEETVVGIPQLGVCFDIGKAPEQIISINNLLLTHGHMDHAAGIAYYLSHRKFSGQSSGTILAPANLLEPVGEILDAWGRLDGNSIPVNFISMRPGDEYQIKPNLFARAFATKHSRGSLGFSIIEKKKKLKEKYLGLAAPQIVELKKKGTTIDYTIESPIVTYLGDTRYHNFSKFEFIAKSKILIAECTFVNDEHIDRALAGAHMHVDEFVEMVKSFDNEHIIVTHLSQRTHIGEAKKILREKLGQELYSRIIILMDRKYRTV